jgi:hypothetical protein
MVVDEDGKPYKAPEKSPILVTGDSFVSIYVESSANFPAHLARELGTDVSYTARPHGGAYVPSQLARKGAAYLEGRTAVIWLFVANNILPYMDAEWRSVQLPE